MNTATSPVPFRRPSVAAITGAVLMSASLLVPTLAALAVPVQAAEPTAAVEPANDIGSEVERLTSHISDPWNMPLAATQRIVEAAFSQSQAHGISPTLILAVVAQESAFRTTARSSYGAQGLMQVSARHHPEKLKGLQHSALYRPETNIRVGTQVLAEYLDQHKGRLDQALRKYSGNANAYPRKIRTFWAKLEQVRRSAGLTVVASASPRM